MADESTCGACRWFNYCHLEFSNLKFADQCKFNPSKFSASLTKRLLRVEAEINSNSNYSRK